MPDGRTQELTAADVRNACDLFSDIYSSSAGYDGRVFRAQVPGWFPVDEDLTVLGSGVAEIALGAAFVGLCVAALGALPIGIATAISARHGRRRVGGAPPERALRRRRVRRRGAPREPGAYRT